MSEGRQFKISKMDIVKATRLRMEEDNNNKPPQYEVNRSETRATYLQFCMIAWLMTKKNIHYHDFKRIYRKELKTLFNKK
jgi:hypothetical protein